MIKPSFSRRSFLRAQEHGIRICYHNHPQRKDNPGYKVLNPHSILELTKDCS